MNQQLNSGHAVGLTCAPFVPDMQIGTAFANPEDYMTPEARQAWLLRWIHHNAFYSSTEHRMVFAYYRLTGAEIAKLNDDHWSCPQLQDDLDAMDARGDIECFLENNLHRVRSCAYLLSKEQDEKELNNTAPMPVTWHINR
jgi:hypothetical protein